MPINEWFMWRSPEQCSAIFDQSALDRLHILDTEPEEAFDDVAKVAASVFSVPFAGISFFDSEREWLKTCVGLPCVQIPLFASIGYQFARATEPVTCADLDTVEEIRHLPWISGAPRLRFFAAAPILFDHGLVGLLWVGGCASFRTSKAHLAALSALARQTGLLAENKMHLHHLHEALQYAESTEQIAAISAKRFEGLFGGLPIAAFTFDQEGTIFEWNKAAEQLWEIEAHRATLQPISSAIDQAGTDLILQEVSPRIFAGEKVESLEWQEVTPQGRERWIRAEFVPLRGAVGSITGAIAACEDVTYSKLSEKRILSNESKFRTAIQALDEALLLLDRTGVITLANPSCELALGYPPLELIGSRIDDPRWEVMDEDGLSLSGELHPAIRAIRIGEAQRGVILHRTTATGDLQWLRANAVPLHEMDAGDDSAVVLSLSDVTQQRSQEAQIQEHMYKLSDYGFTLERQREQLEEANEKLTSLATTDGLTGLFNHRYFQDFLEKEVQKSFRHKTPLGLLLLDVDHFKNFNDTYGHPAGDQVLRTVAAVLQKEARQSDIVCRYGGEEFAVILVNPEAGGAQLAAERFREAIEASNPDGRRVTASFGLAFYDLTIESRQQLIKRTDSALYQAKHAGRNRVMTWQSEDEQVKNA